MSDNDMEDNTKGSDEVKKDSAPSSTNINRNDEDVADETPAKSTAASSAAEPSLLGSGWDAAIADMDLDDNDVQDNDDAEKQPAQTPSEWTNYVVSPSSSSDSDDKIKGTRKAGTHAFDSAAYAGGKYDMAARWTLPDTASSNSSDHQASTASATSSSTLPPPQLLSVGVEDDAEEEADRVSLPSPSALEGKEEDDLLPALSVPVSQVAAEPASISNNDAPETSALDGKEEHALLPTIPPPASQAAAEPASISNNDAPETTAPAIADKPKTVAETTIAASPPQKILPNAGLGLSMKQSESAMGSEDASQMSADISDFVFQFASTTLAEDDDDDQTSSLIGGNSAMAAANDNLDDILGPMAPVAEEEDEEERKSAAQADVLIQMTKAAIDALTGVPSEDDQEIAWQKSEDSAQRSEKSAKIQKTMSREQQRSTDDDETKGGDSVNLIDLASKSQQSEPHNDISNNATTAPAAIDALSPIVANDVLSPTAASNALSPTAEIMESGMAAAMAASVALAPPSTPDTHSVLEPLEGSGDGTATDDEPAARFNPFNRIVESLQSTFHDSTAQHIGLSSLLSGGESTLSPNTMTTISPHSTTAQTASSQQHGGNPRSPGDGTEPSKFTFDSIPTNRSDLQQQHEQRDQQQKPQTPIPGGRLWEAAQTEAVYHKSEMPRTVQASKFAQSLLAHTRSRAEPDALLQTSGTMDSGTIADAPTMVQINENEDAFIVNTVLARKRVRVVQLLTMGLVAFCFGFMGSFVVESSCHFVSAQVAVGESQESFLLHYGLWKYTPMDSVFQGYSYCYAYDDNYTSDAPMFPRWSSCVAMLMGTYALCVLWYYLILGRASERAWTWAVASSGLAGTLQLSTLQIFAGDVCQRDECTLGPAGAISVIVSVVWFIMAFEMYYNMPTRKVGQDYVQDSLLPISPMSVGSPMSVAMGYVDMDASVAHTVNTMRAPPDEPNLLVAQLELTDFNQASKAYVRRIVPSSVAGVVVGEGGESARETLPSLNRIASRASPRKRSEALMERDLAADTNFRAFV